MSIAHRLLRVLVFALISSPVLALDPSLPDRLLSDDASVRATAREEAAALTEGDRRNLAASLTPWLSDSRHGEQAAQALCRLGSAGVPHLDRYARVDEPNAGYAVMGLLREGNDGQAALAALLQNGDPAAILRALSVVEQTGLMPSVVGDEVRRLAGEPDARLSAAAQKTLAAVAAKSEKKDEWGAAGKAAFSLEDDAELSAALSQIEKALSGAAGSPAEGAAASPSPAETTDKFAPHQIDTSGFRSRKSASELFTPNAHP